MARDRNAVKLAVWASLGIELAVHVEALPQRRLRAQGCGFRQQPGGHGHVQAVAAARLGASVELLGMVGDDPFGRQLLADAQMAGVLTAQVDCCPDEPTGLAVNLVCANDSMEVAYVPGANGTPGATYAQRVAEQIAAMDVLLVRLDVPESAVAALLCALPERRPLVVLDPDLVDVRPSEFPWERIDFLTTRLDHVQAGGAVLASPTAQTVARACARHLKLGLRHVVVRAGASGAYLVEPDGVTHFPGYPARVMDPNGAGDVFNAALGCMLGEGRGPYAAIDYANAAAAIAVARVGAVASAPSQQEVVSFLARFPAR